MIITKEILRENPNWIFVFGDNLIRKGKGGAAVLRDEPNTFGFITKKYPNNNDSSFYKPDEYRPIFEQEVEKLEKEIENNPHKLFLVAKLGSQLANRYSIFEEVIEQWLRKLPDKYDNVVLLF